MVPLLFVLMKLCCCSCAFSDFSEGCVLRGRADGGDAKSAKVRGCAERAGDVGLGDVDGGVEAMVAAAESGWWGA